MTDSKSLIGLKIEENVPLAPLTTLKIGGAARFFASAKSENDVLEAFEFARKNSLEVFILGGGSNVLVADEGFDGLVLQIALKGISTFRENDKTVFAVAQAGEDWDEFVSFCVEKNLAGVECLSGIPGFIGGTPVQNVGAYGQDVAETIAAVRVFDRKTFEIREMTNADCRFSYRASVFNTTDRNRFVVLAVTFALKENGAPKIAYRDLQEFFGERNRPKPTLRETRAAVWQIRAAKSMVIDESDPNSRSAGSFFKNPVVTKEKFLTVGETAKNLGIARAPGFAVDETHIKIPAAWLIEHSGFRKGFCFGNVGISTRHTLALVNLGGASARDVLRFKDEIQRKVKNVFDIELQPEPVFVGFRSE
jgi:UDP-N-acetylmuramate dehydrogenase